MKEKPKFTYQNAREEVYKGEIRHAERIQDSDRLNRLRTVRDLDYDNGAVTGKLRNGSRVDIYISDDTIDQRKGSELSETRAATLVEKDLPVIMELHQKAEIVLLAMQK